MAGRRPRPDARSAPWSGSRSIRNWLIAILIGYMVGKVVRKGSNGLGGRSQQILAVLPTYFAITFSYVAVMIYGIAEKPAPAPQQQQQNIDVGQVLVGLVTLAAVAPFLALQSGPGAALSLLIIFFGLRQAWRLTGRSQLEIFGPYEAENEAET